MPEIRGEIALGAKDQPGLEAALKALEEEGAPFATIAVLRARAQEKRLIKVVAEKAGEEEDDEKVSPWRRGNHPRVASS